MANFLKCYILVTPNCIFCRKEILKKPSLLKMIGYTRFHFQSNPILKADDGFLVVFQNRLVTMINCHNEFQSYCCLTAIGARLRPCSNRSPYILTLVQNVKNRNYTIHTFINFYEGILCRDFVSYFI